MNQKRDEGAGKTMKFRAKTYFWNRYVIKAFLIPGLAVLGGVTADPWIVHAQQTAMTKQQEYDDLIRRAREAMEAKRFDEVQKLMEAARKVSGTSGSIEPASKTVVKDTVTDPRQLMEMARKAIAAGNLEDAERHAEAAMKYKSTTSWGIFESTPNTVVKEVQEAKAEFREKQSETLLDTSRQYINAKAENKNQRIDNLAMAEKKAMEAQKLGVEYPLIHFGDRPEDLLLEIEKIRVSEQLPKQVVKEESKTPATPATTASNTTKPAGWDEPRNNAAQQAEMVRVAAIKLMDEARAAQIGGDLATAQKKLFEASRLRATFKSGEETPDLAMQKLHSAANKKISALCAEARVLSSTDAAGANERLQTADNMAKSLGLDNYLVMETRKSMSNVPATAPVAVTPPQIPGLKMPSVVQASGTTPIETGHATELLNKARTELRAGDTKAARLLAEEVIKEKMGMHDEAQALLKTIETEEFELKRSTARRAFDNGLACYNSHQYARAYGIFKQIDPNLLPASKKAELSELMHSSQVRAKSIDSTIAMVKSEEPAVPKVPTVPDMKDKLPNVLPDAPMNPVPPVPPSVPPIPPSALPGPEPKTPGTGPDNLLKQQENLAKVEVQRLRSESLKVENEAINRFGRGETDAAMQDLENFISKVQASNISKSAQQMIVRPIEARMDRLRVLKHQQDFLTKEAKDRREFFTEMTQDALFKQKKQEEVQKLMREAASLMKINKPKEAYALLQKAQQLDPEDPGVQASKMMAEVMYRKSEFDRVKSNQEEFNWREINESFDVPNRVNSKDLYKHPEDPEYRDRVMRRREIQPGYSRQMRSAREKELQSKLDTPVEINFQGMPLEKAIDSLRTYTKLNFHLDKQALVEAGIDPSRPVDAQLKGSLKSALNIMCGRDLGFTIENEAISITTQRALSGRMDFRTFGVGDLVIPIATFGRESGRNPLEELYPSDNRNNNQFRSPGSRLPNGQPVGAAENTPFSSNTSAVGRISNTPSSGGAVSRMVNGSNTLERELIRVITETIRPDTWKDQGGAGTIEYYPTNLSLVINQSPDVLEEVDRLLASLRSLQDLEVSIEIKLVSLSETFYERIGVDFAMGIPTGSSLNASAPNSPDGQIRLNGNDFRGNVVGLQAPGAPTPDLDIPIRTGSFNRAIPPFGGYFPLGDGGLALGMAFLSDIQVQLFLEAAQGDSRTNVMQAPRVTVFNGAASQISVNDTQLFLTSVNAAVINGQVIVVPQIDAVPVGSGGGGGQQGGLGGGGAGLGMFVQAIVSHDRRFVRMSIQQNFSNLSGVQSVPFTTFITPVFDNGATGQPTPFTTFLQLPRISSLSVDTTVVVPDGGTVVMGGLKYMAEGRNEFGPPVLSKIPYVSRLFKNVAYGRDGRSILIMVTPRIIITREEQLRQTGVDEDNFQQP
ncbi:MAG: hypothetical protein R3B84_17725 [Zavarzinella sp.]